jgi:hypothetical protein
MTPRQLHRLLIAPEIVVIDAVRAALFALERAILVEHPLLDLELAHDDTPSNGAPVQSSTLPTNSVARCDDTEPPFNASCEARANDLPF